MLILYAEDDIDDYYIFVEAVESINSTAKCINARNGEEVLHMLEELVVLPDMIFMDINMPAMDGKGCLRALRIDERFRDIPVIVYTTSTNPRDEEHCLQLGVTAYMQKPNNMPAIVRCLSDFIMRRS